MKRIMITSYSNDPKLGPMKTLKNQYIDVTASLGLMEVKGLFISFTNSHKHVTSSTIGRWLKTALETSGIDTKEFKAHSTTN